MPLDNQALLFPVIFACDGAWQIGVSPVAARNATGSPIVLGVQRYERAFDCDAASDAEYRVAVEEYSPATIESLASGEAAALASGGDARVLSEVCGTAMITSEHGGPWRVSWDVRGLDLRTNHSEPPTAGLVYLEQFGEELRPYPGPGMFVFPGRPSND